MRRRLDRRRGAATLIFVVAMFALPAASGQCEQVAGRQRQTVAITFADGRTIEEPPRQSGAMWTPLFPRIPGAATARDGLPLTALGVEFKWDASTVTVIVSLIWGSPQQARQRVASAVLVPGALVQVDELRSFGVEPITLAIVPQDPTVTFPPNVACVSTMLDVRVEPSSPEVPAYRVTVANNGRRPLLAFQYKGYRSAGVAALTGRRKDMRLRAIAQPGEEVSFELILGAGTDVRGGGRMPPAPLDRFEITMVLWDDGTVEGDPEAAAQERAAAAGVAQQLARILSCLQQAATDAEPARSRRVLRRSLDTLSINAAAPEGGGRESGGPGFPGDPARLRLVPLGLQRAKEEALRDLDAFEREHPEPDAEPWAAWLAATTADYRRWLTRAARLGGTL